MYTHPLLLLCFSLKTRPISIMSICRDLRLWVVRSNPAELWSGGQLLKNKISGTLNNLCVPYNASGLVDRKREIPLEGPVRLIIFRRH
jgi:hypothetical protein